MALYHFTMKSDRKPNKKKVKASDHSDYINREGKYLDLDELKQKDLENIITSAGAIRDVFHETPALLYHSPYGDISNTARGVAVYHHPSIDTIAIALMVSHKKMQSPLVIRGSDAFKAKCIVAAVTADLPITFADASMQKLFEQKKEEDQHERREYREQGGRIRSASKTVSQPHVIQSRRKIADAPTTRTLPTMRDLSQRHLVPPRQLDTPVLVPDHEQHLVGDGGSGSDAALRRFVQDGRSRGIWADFRAGRSSRARRTADGILSVLEENADRVQAASHVEYINRENAFAKKGGCVYQENKLPPWAHGSSKEFFRAADRYSPKTVGRYKEFEFSLQNELTLEQNLEIVRRFIDTMIPNHYYAFAVHDKIGALSEETHNLHVHLMFSPRVIDEAEEKQPRKKTQYFKYPMRANVKNPTEEMQRTHGAPIDRRLSDRKSGFISECRAVFAQITNETLEKYGHRARVDHRSLKEQEKEARMNGDTVLADLLHRIPEKHISKMGLMEERNPDVARLLRFRAQKKEYRDLIMQAGEMERRLKEAENEEKKEHLEKNVKALVGSNAYLESDNDASSYIGELRENFLQAIEECDKIRSGIVPVQEAYDDARMEYMTDDEQELYERYHHLQEERDHWEIFQKNLKEPPEDVSEEERQAVAELHAALKEKFQTMDRLEASLKPQVDAILKKQENPDIKKQIFLIAHQILEGNKHQQMLLDKAQQNLDVAMQTLEQALFSTDQAEMHQSVYSTKELYQIIRRRFYGYKKEVERLEKQVEAAEKKVLSPERIQEIAEDKFTNGACKALRAERRKYAKKEASLSQSIDKYLEMEKVLQQLPKDSPDYQSTRLLLEDLHRQNNAVQESLREWNAKLDREEQDLRKRMATPEARKKIHRIALGVARKNAKPAERYHYLLGKLNQAKEKLERVRPQMEAIQKAYEKDKRNTRKYRVEQNRLPKDAPPPSRQDQPDMIAQALAGDAVMPKNVSCRDDDDDQGMKNWTLMSELEKEEEYNRKFSQQL